MTKPTKSKGDLRNLILSEVTTHPVCPPGWDVSIKATEGGRWDVESISPHQSIAYADCAKPQWEFPRLCRGGSKSLTYPGVDTAAPSTKLRIASRQAHEEGFD